MAENDNIGDELEDEQFNSMLNAAQKQVGASAENQNVSPAAQPDAPAPSLGVGSGKLSQAQIEAMLALNGDLTSGEESAEEETPQDTEQQSDESEQKNAAEEPQDEDTAIADRLREGIEAEMQASSEESQTEETPDDSKKKKKEKKEKASKEKKEKQPIDPVLLQRIITVAAAVVALVLGFCICLLFFTDVIKSGNEQFAIKAANAVNSKLRINTEFYVCKAYVNNGALADECMLYGYTCYEGEEKLDIYRVVVEKAAPTIVNVYYTIDENSYEYEAMKASDDSKDRIKASQLKYHSDSIFDADREIQINSPNWEKIDCTLINRNITSQQEKR